MDIILTLVFQGCRDYDRENGLIIRRLFSSDICPFGKVFFDKVVVV